MGCWNGTCGISQIPITVGTPVKAVIIMNKAIFPAASGFCYQSGYADPISFVIEGQYNDYGVMENIENTKSMRLFKEYFNTGIKDETIKVESDKDSDGDIDYTKISNEQLINLLERDRVQIKTSYFDWDEETQKGGLVYAWVSIGIMMTHATVFDSVRDSLYNSEYDYKEFTEESIKQDCLYAVEDLFENNIHNNELDKIREKIKVAEKNNNYELKEKLNANLTELIRLSTLMDIGWKNDMIRKTGKWSNQVNCFGGNEKSDMTAFKTYYDMLVNDYNKNEKKEIIDMMAEMIILMNIMTSLRKPWMSQSGKGSQSFDEDAYTGLANGMINAVYKNKEGI